MLTKRKKIGIAVCLVLLSSIMLGCIERETQEPATTTQVEQVLVVGDNSGVSSISVPRGAATLKEKARVIEALIEVDPNLALKPGLTESWEQLSETEWKLKLRKDVKFHDGTPFNAEAVKFSLEWAMEQNPKVKGVTQIKSVDVVDDHTLIITTVKPFASFIATLAYPDTAIISPTSVKDGKFIKPIGTGPFKFYEWDQATHDLTVVANKEYWKGAPKLEKVVIKAIRDPVTRSVMIEKGEVDFTCDTPPGDIKRLKSVPEIKVEVYDMPRIYWMTYTTIKQPPYDDVRIRKAINYAINREGIAEHVLLGCGKPATGPFPPCVPWGNKDIKGYGYDPERAKELLEEAGWKDTDGDEILDKNGKPFKVTLISYSSRPGMTPIAEALQAQFRDVGLNAEVLVLESGAKSARQKEKIWGDIFLTAWTTAYVPDPDYFLRAIYHSEGIANTYGYENKQIDELLDQAVTTADPKARQEIYNRIQEIGMDEAPIIITAYYRMTIVMRDYVKGYVYDPTAHDYILDYNMYISKG